MKNIFKFLLVLFAASTAVQAQNLVITNVDVPTGPFQPGDTVALTATVLNADTVNPLSAGSNTVVSAEVDGFIDTYNSLPINSAIAPEETLGVTILIPILQSTANGFYLVEEVTVDAFTADNVGTFEVRAFSDLAIDNLELSDGPYYPGSAISYTIDYSNPGARDAGAFVIRVDVVAPPTGTDYSLQREIPGGLAAGASGRVVLTELDAVPPQDGVVPLDNPNGTFEVTATIDYNNAVPEDGRLENNTAEATFTIDTKPELAITNLSYEAGIWQLGDPVDFSLTFENLPIWDSHNTLRVENRPDQRYRIDVVLSTDPVFGNEDDFLLYSVILSGHPGTGGNLLPGDAFTFEWSQAMPRNLAGDYFVLARIDVNDNIDEYLNDDPLRNGNNTWYDTESAKITITPGPAPQPTTYRASVNAEGQEGDNISDEPSLSNDGRYLVFSSLAGFDADDENGVYDIYLRDNLTGKLTWVSRPLNVGFGHGDSRLPRISGDGRFIVFQSDSDALTATDPNGHTDIFLYQTETGTLTQLSRSPAGDHSNDSSYQPSISDDGEWVVFESHAQNLLDPVVPSAARQIYAYNRISGEINLVSLADGGGMPNGQSYEATVSATGSHIVFVSDADNITADAVSGKQVYRVDIDGANAVLVSQSAGVAGNGFSVNPDLSANGNIVVFSSLATNLDPLLPITNGIANAFIRDINAATIERIVSPSGAEANAPSNFDSGDVGVLDARISGDGRFVIFRTQSDNLLPLQIERSDGMVYNLSDFGPGGYNPATDDVVLGYSDLNSTNTFAGRAHSDLYLFDRDNPDATLLVSVNKFGYQGTSNFLVEDAPTSPSVRRAVISGNGRYVAFTSEARGAFGFDHGRTNQISANNNNVRDVYIHDLRTIGNFEFANPPIVELLNPGEGDVLTVGQSVVINVSATDNNGYVEVVDFYVNGILLDSVERGDFFTHWTPQLPGVYTISVVATDNDGIRREDSVTITANDSDTPGVSLIYPVSGESYFTNSDITLGAVANTTSSGITQVEFFVDGESTGVAGSSPYTLDWSASGPGNYIITAVATNTVGQQGISNPVLITIVDPAAPVVTITEPTPGSTLTVDATTTFAATVTGSGVLIASVEYFVNGQSIGFASAQDGVWFMDFTPQSLGVAEVRALATDSSGNTYSSVLEVYTVVSGFAPVATIVSPDPADTLTPGVADETLQRGEEYLFSVSASDPDGEIDSVEFFLGGRSLGNAVESTSADVYELLHAPQLLGMQRFRAYVQDNTGNTTIVEINYNVMAGTPPNVVLLNIPAFVQRNSTHTLEATATATVPGVSIVSVEFFADGVSLGMGVADTTLGNFSLDWTPSLSGLYAIEVVATDSLGSEASATDTISVILGDPPTVTLLGDGTGNGIADDSGTVFEVTRLQADASDPDGNIVSAEFFVDGQSVGFGELGSSSGLYVFDWVPQGLGQFQIVVVVTDNDGNQASDTLRFDIVTGLPPVVELQGDTTGDGQFDDPVRLLEPIVLQALASDPDGVVVAVDFTVNGIDIGSGELNGSTGFFELEWIPQGLGLVTVVATAEDNGGNRVSDSLFVEVISGAVPVITWLSPDPTDVAPADGVADEVLRLNETVEIRVEATDDDGTIELVEVFANNRLLGSATQRDFVNQYVFDYVPSLLGLHELRVVATDNSGNRTAESFVFNVVAGTPPNATITAPDPADLNLDGVADQELPRNTTYNLTATAMATAVGSSVVEVRFFANGELLGAGLPSVTLGNYVLSWKPELSGLWDITVEVEDSLGTVSTDSVTYSVVLGSSPQVELTAEDADLDGIADELLTVFEPYLLEASASDIYGNIRSVLFFVDGEVLGEGTLNQTSGNYELSWSPPALGLFIIDAVATDNDGNESRSRLRFRVQTGFAPVVTLLGDVDNDGVYEDDVIILSTLPLVAEASDLDGLVEQVEFFANGESIGLGNFDGNLNGYTVDWVPSMLGANTIRAVAIDNSGNTSFDELIFNVTVGAAPVISWVSPSPVDNSGDGIADGNLRLNESIEIVIDATDSDGVVERVEFYVNGSFLGEGSESGFLNRYAISFTPELAGLYSLEAVAIDNNGNRSRETHVFNVVTGALPQITILSPDPTDSNNDGVGDVDLLVFEQQTLAANIVHPEGLIENVEVWINGRFVGNAQPRGDLNRYALDFRPQLTGQYLITFRAYDDLGNQASRSLRFNVIVGTAPVVSILHPVDIAGDGIADDDFPLGQSVELRVHATDPDGQIVEVQFYINGSNIGQAQILDTLNEYVIVYNPSFIGTYNFRADVTDNSGNQVSVGQQFTVTSGSVPVVEILAPDPTDGSGDGVADINLTVNQSVTLAASAEDADGYIEDVEFFINGALQGQALLNPSTNRYELSYVLSTIGILRFDVDATDNLGNRTRETAFYQVSSGLPPVVELVSPDPSDLNGDGFADITLSVQRSLQWVATVEDGDGHVASVEFVVNGQSLGFANESGAVGRYVINYTPVLTGNYRVEVIASDDLGNQSSVSHNFQVTPGISPTISILSPPAGGSYLPGTILPVQVIASDEDGLVFEVSYYLNGVLVGAFTESPFRTSISLPAPGNYVLEAIATDNDGNRTVSAPRLLTAGPPDPITPLVVVNHPLPLGDGDDINDVSVASAMYLNAEVNSPEDNIADVRFYINASSKEFVG